MSAEDVKPRVKRDVKKRVDQFCLDNDLVSFSQGIDLLLKKNKTLDSVRELCVKYNRDCGFSKHFADELDSLLEISTEENNV